MLSKVLQEFHHLLSYVTKITELNLHISELVLRNFHRHRY
jgi:hypothetical protein